VTEGQKIRAELHVDYAIENVARALQILEGMKGGAEPMSPGRAFTVQSYVQQAARHVGFVEEITINCEVPA
jgi:hypothetical protein